MAGAAHRIAGLREAGGQELTLESELVVLWGQGPGFGHDHSYSLIFHKPIE